MGPRVTTGLDCRGIGAPEFPESIQPDIRNSTLAGVHMTVESIKAPCVTCDRHYWLSATN